MFRVTAICLLILLAFACKKKDTPEKPAPEPEAPKKGTLIIDVTTFDTTGTARSEHSGVKVLLQNGMSKITDSSGIVSFNDLNYGIYAPSLVKDGYDGAPVTFQLNAASQTFSLPCAMHSPYRTNSQQAYIVTADSIVMSFQLSKPVPAGALVKVAILTSTLSGMTAGTPQAADMITVSTQSVSNVNIAQLPGFKKFVATLSKEQIFFVSAVPLSYGLYNSNFSAAPVLVGENLFYPGNLQLKKNW